MHLIARGSTDSRQWTQDSGPLGPGGFLRLKYSSNDNFAILQVEHM